MSLPFPDFLTMQGKDRTISHLPERTTVFAQGDRCDGLYFIQTGRVKLSIVSKRGKQAIIGWLGPGDFIGEGCLDGSSAALATATTMAESTITHIKKRAFQEALHAEPMVAEFFVRYLLSRNLQFEQDLIDQLFNSSEKRLARILLLMAHYGKDGEIEPKVPKVTQETLAELVGTTRSRVSKFMTKFEKLGFISYEDGLTVHNSLLKIVLHDSNPLGSPQSPTLFSRAKKKKDADNS
jgi:CRP-like cAMP-binding protein